MEWEQELRFVGRKQGHRAASKTLFLVVRAAAHRRELTASGRGAAPSGSVSLAASGQVCVSLKDPDGLYGVIAQGGDWILSRESPVGSGARRAPRPGMPTWMESMCMGLGEKSQQSMWHHLVTPVYWKPRT